MDVSKSCNDVVCTVEANSIEMFKMYFNEENAEGSNRVCVIATENPITPFGWNINDICEYGGKNDSDWSINEKEWKNQIVVDMDINIQENGVTVTNVNNTEAYSINNPDNELKERFIQMLKILSGRNDYLPPKSAIKVNQINQVNHSNKIAHISIYESRIGLGINYSRWNKSCSASKLFTLSHEITHILVPTHTSRFYLQQLEFIKRMLKKKESVEDIFTERIDWGLIKSMFYQDMMWKDISEKEEDVMRKLANSALDYSHQTANMLHLNPPQRGFQPEWYHNTDDYSQIPENIIEEPMSNIVIPNEFSDREIADYLEQFESNPQDEFEYIFDEDDVPIVDDDGRVVENRKFARVYHVIKQRSEIPDSCVEDISDKTIPVKRHT